MDSKLLGAPAEIPGFLSEHWDGSCRSKSLISPDYGVRGPGGGRGPMPVTPHDSAGAPSIFSEVEQKWDCGSCHRRVRSMSCSSTRWSVRRPINWRRHQGWVSAINCSSWRRMVDGLSGQVRRGDARHLSCIPTSPPPFAQVNENGRTPATLYLCDTRDARQRV
jgi:hypothetical protein